MTQYIQVSIKKFKNINKMHLKFPLTKKKSFLILQKKSFEK